MIGVFVTFRGGDNFDERAVRNIAETGVRPTVEFVQIATLVENVRPVAGPAVIARRPCPAMPA